MKKYLIYVIGTVVAVAAISFFAVGGARTISADTVISGDYGVDKKTVVENGALLTVNGDLTVRDSLSCKDGPLSVVVNGDATIDGTVLCNREGSEETASIPGISIVVTGSITFGKDAQIVSNGNVQIVQNSSALLIDEAKIEELYEETGKDSGQGTRIGPFVSANPTQKVTAGSETISPVAVLQKNGAVSFVRTAQAQGPQDDQGNAVPNVVLGGKWYIGNGGVPPAGLDIPKPPKGIKKIIVNFDFGKDGNVAFNDFYLAGPDGRDGKSDMGQNCNARGEKGEDAFRMRVQAANITLNNFTLELGDGGKGGDAETKKDCDPGIATGGDGGEAGNFKMTALGKIEIASFHIIPGVGGIGGNATGKGKDGLDACPGEKGGDAIAHGGKGGNNKKELAAVGAVGGISNVTIDSVEGGWGGKGTANPGKGGNGTACKCNGGKGGNGNADGGKGGDASVKVIGGAGEANGGNGGDADTHGGNGGNGGSCNLVPQGGKGGNGGNAVAKEGKGGKGTSANGEDGTVIDETGGDGGNGGDGCGPGNGGGGGLGKPNGKDGQPGKKECPGAAKKDAGAVTVPGETPKSVTTPTTPPVLQTEPPTAPQQKIKAIQYRGKYLPVEQLIIEDEVGCGAEHWHALEGVVRATDGSFVQDPGPQCGYGKVAQTPVTEISAPASQ